MKQLYFKDGSIRMQLNFKGRLFLKFFRNKEEMNIFLKDLDKTN